MAGNSIAYPQAQQDDTVYSFSPAEMAEVEKHLVKYPDKRSAVMPLLWMVQEKYGWLSNGAMQLVADTLELTFAQVYGVATFYTMYLKDDRARNLVEVCTCFACGECGGRELYQYGCESLAVNEHGVSADGQIHLREAECLGACDTAVVVQINNRPLRYNVTPEQFDQIVADLRAGKTLEFESVPLYSQA